MNQFDFDNVNNRYNTGCYKYDRIKSMYPTANEDTIVMTLADMDFKTAPCIIEDFKALAERGIFGYMTEYYPPYQNAVINWYQQNYDLKLFPENIIYYNGTLEALKAIICLHTLEEDNVMLSTPIYGNFMVSIREIKRNIINVPVIKENNKFSLDYQEIENNFKNGNIKVYLLCSPHNPIGRVYSKEELTKLIELCRKYNVVLISDEVHSDIKRHNVKHYPIVSLAKENDKIYMLTSIGKTFNVSGIQLSNIICINKELVNQFRNNYDKDISVFAQCAVISALSKGKPWKEALNLYLDNNINFAYNYIKNNIPQIEVIYPEGTYFLWLDLKKANIKTDNLAKYVFEKANLILQNGEDCDPINGKHCLRMVLPYPRSIVEEALKRLKFALENC